MSPLALAFFPLVSVGATIETSNLHLLWSAPRDCPSAEQVRTQVYTLVSRGGADALTRPIYVIASVKQRGESQWELEIEWHGSELDSKKTMESDSCVDLARAAALTTALVIDPNANLPTTTDPTDTSSNESSVVVVPDARAVPPRAPAEPRERPGGDSLQKSRTPISQDESHVDVSSGVVVQGGVMPEFSTGLGLGVTVHRGAWVMRGEVGVFLPAAWQRDNYRGTLWLAEVLFGPCYGIRTGRLQIAPCLGGSWQNYWVRSEPVDDAQQRTDWATGIRGGLGLSAWYRLTPSFALHGSAWALAAAKWPRFLLRPDIDVFTPESVAIRVGLGIAYEAL